MQEFFKTHKQLIENLEVYIQRSLMREVDWNHRLIGIKGARGVGKTTFLLDYAKTTYGTDKSCLYVNLNNLYFSDRTIISFADEFRKTGGRVLILDQVFKYPNWSEELRFCYDNFTDLQIVFSGSSVMQLGEENELLRDVVAFYNLEGFSFREYLNLKTGQDFSELSLQDILENHETIAAKIVSKVKPLAYFNDYLHHGFYPNFVSKKTNFVESLLKIINLIMEIDISYLRQVELKYLPKLRKLVYLVAQSAPFQPNVSKLSNEVETSRATIMNYLKYLKEARLIKMLFENQESAIAAKKPDLIYLHNPNLYYSVYRGEGEEELLHRTFFLNQVGAGHAVYSSKEGDFLVGEKNVFFVGGRGEGEVEAGHTAFFARDMLEIGKGNLIPLWLFGFLY